MCAKAHSVFNGMTMRERLQADLKMAMKDGDSFTTGIIRLLISVLRERALEREMRGSIFSEEESLSVLGTEAKKRREAADLYRKGGRDDLAEKEERELEVIFRYLPKQLSVHELEASVKNILTRVRAKDFGAAMRAVIGELKGKGDAKLISEIIKKEFGAGEKTQ